MKILITGSQGFIGRAVARDLAERGHELDYLDKQLGADVRDPDVVDQLVKGADAVVHLAGVLGTSELFDNVHQAISINVGGTANVLDSCVRHSARYVGVTVPDVWPSVYQATKLSAQRLAEAYANRYDLPVAHVKPFNVYGPGQAVGAGHPQKIIPTFTTCCYTGVPIPIWGDGLQTVDLVHVDDVAAAFVRVVEHEALTNARVLEVGSGKETTVIDVARLVAAAAGTRFVVEYLPMRSGELPGTHLCAFAQVQDGDFMSDERFAQAVRSYSPFEVAEGRGVKAAVLTSIYGSYDDLKPAHEQDGAVVDWICVTDDPNLSADGWHMVVDPRPNVHPNRAAKRPKMLPWQYTDATQSVWIDASFAVTSPTFVVDVLSYADPIAQFVHPWRDCIYTEADASIPMPKYYGQPIPDQMRCYIGTHPAQWGLWATGVIAHEHTPEIKAFGEQWLAECTRWSFQDQLSEPVALRDNGLRPTPLPGDHLANDWLAFHPSMAH